MTAQEWKFQVLVTLAGDLHRLSRCTVTMVFKSWGDPVVLLPVCGRRHVTIMACCEGSQVYSTWGRTRRVEVGPSAARSIAEAVTR
jgi:hypothetical protein